MYTYAHCAGFGCISRISIDYVFFFFSWAVLITWFARHLQEGMEEQEEDSEENVGVFPRAVKKQLAEDIQLVLNAKEELSLIHI